MNTVNTLIKWPGGKAREIKYIEHLIPKFDRYIEPFLGGGAMFFYLRPQKAVLNDISKDLIDFYRLSKEQNTLFRQYLDCYALLFEKMTCACSDCYAEIFSLYKSLNKNLQGGDIHNNISVLVEHIISEANVQAVGDLVLDIAAYKKELCINLLDKMQRTVKNEAKAPFCEGDLKENLITGLLGGTYMYFRSIYNDIAQKRLPVASEYRTANFYFIREYCYGSMFRYNSKGEFNIPYGGMSYNRKDFHAKVNDIFSQSTSEILSRADIHCSDFEDFMSSVDITENDFMFLDPPYDTDFSSYEGKDFTQKDQQRLAETLKKTKAQFILIIKNTDFIYSLYEHNFNILCFDKTYTYNVRSRNERNVEHLIITNIPT